jgi:hypothetical protein
VHQFIELSSAEISVNIVTNGKHTSDLHLSVALKSDTASERHLPTTAELAKNRMQSKNICNDSNIPNNNDFCEPCRQMNRNRPT